MSKSKWVCSKCGYERESDAGPGPGFSFRFGLEDFGPFCLKCIANLFGKSDVGIMKKVDKESD